jgi:error-prone DNA polymerase
LEEKAGNYCALRLGFRQVKGMREEDINVLLKARTATYKSIDELRHIGLSESTLKQLADADAFRSIGVDRREALWEISKKDTAIGVFEGQPNDDHDEQEVMLPRMKESEHVVQDYATISLSLKAHPVSFVREKLEQLHVINIHSLPNCTNGQIIKIAGLVLVRQRPGTAKGVCFMTIEDETGFANVVFFEKLFEKFRKEILQSRLIMVEGKLQIEGEVIHVIVSNCFNISSFLKNLTKTDDSNAYGKDSLFKRNEQQESQPVFYKGRNFH